MQNTPELILNHADGDGFVVVLPGGGYRMLAEHETTPPLEWLAELGWRAGALRYTVDPSPYPVALTELLGALADVRAGRYGSVTGPVGVLGFSAGGHLAGSAATATGEEFALATARYGTAAARPDFGVLAYPVVDLGELTHSGSRDSLLWELDPGQDWIARLSLQRRVDRRTPPLFIWTTADDASVPARNSLILAEACIEHQVPVELHVYPHGEHGLGMHPEPAASAWRECGQWLAGRLDPAPR